MIYYSSYFHLVWHAWKGLENEITAEKKETVLKPELPTFAFPGALANQTRFLHNYPLYLTSRYSSPYSTVYYIYLYNALDIIFWVVKNTVQTNA